MSLQVHSEKIRQLISQSEACHKKYQIHQYLLALLHWLTDIPMVNFSDHCNNEPCQFIRLWLGDKNPAKERMVRLLLVRLGNEWKSFKKLQQGTNNRKLEYQICNMDIYHNTFPDNLNALLKKIGGIKPDPEQKENFGFYAETETNIEYEFRELSSWLKSTVQNISVKLNKNEVIRLWLIVSFSKSLRDQISLNSLFNPDPLLANPPLRLQLNG